MRASGALTTRTGISYSVCGKEVKKKWNTHAADTPTGWPNQSAPLHLRPVTHVTAEPAECTGRREGRCSPTTLRFFNNPLLKLINIQNGVKKKQECFVCAINLIANLIERTILGNGFTRAELTAFFLVCQEWVRSFYSLRYWCQPGPVVSTTQQVGLR